MNATTDATDPIAAYEVATTLLDELTAEAAGLNQRLEAAALSGDRQVFNAAVARREALPFLIEAARHAVVRTEVEALDVRIAAQEAAAEPLRQRVETAQAAVTAAEEERTAARAALQEHNQPLQALQGQRKGAWSRIVNQEAADVHNRHGTMEGGDQAGEGA